MEASPNPAETRPQVEALLGAAVSGARYTGVQRLGRTRYHGWWLEDLLFITEDGEQAPAWFLRPPEGHAPVPAVLYCHAHGNTYTKGRDELTGGRPALVGPYGPDLVARGIAALCVEMPCFGARQNPGEGARAKAHLWRGRTLFGQMLAELGAGVSYLQDHEAVDPTRLGALGLSMGGTHAWWLAALDPRIRACVSLCCFADLGRLIDTGQHDGHGIYMTVPGLLRLCSTGRLAGLAAPRALLICVGLQDWSTPEACFAPARAELEASYAASGAPEMLAFHVEPQGGHQETPAMRLRTLEFLSGHL